MAVQIPTTVPSTIRAGDTAKWTQSFSDYPATTWTLTYSLTPFWVPQAQGGQQITFSAEASGSDHLVNQGPAATILWGAGRYAYQATVTDGDDRYTVDSGEIEILPDLATAGQIDPRSQFRRIYDSLEQTIQNWAIKQVSRVTIEGVSFEFRSWKDLKEARDLYLGLVLEEEAETAAGGRSRSILAVFTTPA